MCAAVTRRPHESGGSNPSLPTIEKKRDAMKNKLLPVLILSLLALLSSCAGNSSEQIPTITGNNNPITIYQAPSVDKASETRIDAAGSGYGDVAR